MKKYYMKPSKEDIQPGKIVPIYKNYKDERDILGYAMINYKVKSNITKRTYVRKEIGKSGSKKEPDTLLWKFNRYNITYVDPWLYDPNISKNERMQYIHQVGFTTNWNIAFYLKTTSVNMN